MSLSSTTGTMRVQARAGALALVVASLAACATASTVGGTSPSASAPAASAASSASPAVSAAPVEVECPEHLVEPTPPEHGLGTLEGADAAPEIGAAEAAWLCTYGAFDSDQGADGAVYTWSLQEGPTTVPEESLGEVDTLLSALKPAEDMRACTADLGPRLMLVVATGGARIGVAVDDYGCRDVRLTDDPWSVAPGESAADGVPAGALSGSRDLIATLQGLVAAG